MIDLLHDIQTHYDDRGFLRKPYSKSLLESIGVQDDIKEVFYSYSKKNTLRGMHFQKEPHDHYKIVHVISGSILDVIVDIGTSNFGDYKSKVVYNYPSKILVIPPNYAHGFLALEDSIVLYMTTAEYNVESDTGIHHDSFGFDCFGFDSLVEAD